MDRDRKAPDQVRMVQQTLLKTLRQKAQFGLYFVLNQFKKMQHKATKQKSAK